MKKFTALLLTVLMLFTVVSCGSSDVLKGKWTRNDENYGKITLEFDGKGGAKWGYEIEGITFNDEGSYTIKDNTVTISMKMWDEDKLYTFTADESSLTLSSDNEVLAGALLGEYKSAK